MTAQREDRAVVRELVAVTRERDEARARIDALTGELGAAEARSAALAAGLEEALALVPGIGGPIARLRALLVSDAGAAARELTGLRAFFAAARDDDHTKGSGVVCEACGSLATRDAFRGLGRRCDDHAHSDAPTLPWADVVRMKAGAK